MKVKEKEILFNGEIFYTMDKVEFIDTLRRLIRRVGGDKKYYVAEGVRNEIKKYISLDELLTYIIGVKPIDNRIKISKNILLQLNQLWKK